MKELSNKAYRALFALNGRYKLRKLPVNIAFKLFDSMILSKLLYGSGVWRTYEYGKLEYSHERDKSVIEMVHTRFIKRLLGVNKSATRVCFKSFVT